MSMSQKAWESYPNGLIKQCLLGEDRELSSQNLLQDSTRLFNSSQTDIKLVLFNADRREPLSVNMTCVEDLRRSLLCSTQRTQSYLYHICQQHSWSQLLSDQRTFQGILAFHDVFAPFLDNVHAFGYKNDEDSAVWDGYRRSISIASGSFPLHGCYEFCYNTRYPAENGRKSGSPWSLRQSGVYQQVNLQTRQSVWILLQPSSKALKSVEGMLASLSDEAHPMRAHITLLFITAADWHRYILYLQKQLETLDEKACFSRVGKSHKHDYSVAFSDCQRLQNLRKNLLRTLNVLDSSLEVAQGCKLHCQDLQVRQITPPDGEISMELEAYSSRMNMHRATVKSLLEHSLGTMRLLSEILNYRNDEILHRNGQGLQTNVELLRGISYENKTANEMIASLTEQTSKDSRTLKALTVVATLYLPASLLATVFSSNLVQLQTPTQVGHTGHFVLASEFWLYVVIVVPLTLLTSAFIFVLERKWLTSGRNFRICGLVT